MKLKLKTILIYISALLLFLSINGCAYFNMFFNGRKHFNKGEEVYRTEEKVNRTDYENSLKELSKILEFYPDNSLVPDALLMMGKCYYRLGENLKAKRKYQELIANYKESDLVQEAKLRLVEVAISENAYDLANTMIADISMDKVELEPFELQRLLGELELAKGDTIKAFNYFTDAASKTDNKKWQKVYYKKAADLAENRRIYYSSANNYLKLADISADRKSRYDNTLRYGEMLEKAGAADSAFAVYKSLLDNEEYEGFSFNAQLRVGRWYLAQKKYEEAYTKLDEILRVLEKKPENNTILAEATFWLGEYYLKSKEDLVKSGAMYDSAKTFAPPSDLDFVKQNSKRSEMIKTYQQHRKFCDDYNFLKDSLNRSIAGISKDISETDAKKDSLKIKTYSKELSAKQKELKKLKKDYVKKEYLLGDLFLNELTLPDSAFYHFSIIRSRVDQPYFASRALYEVAELQKQKNPDLSSSLFDSLLLLYPSSMPSNQVRELKGLEKITIIEDSTLYYFNLASDAILVADYQLADRYYNLALRQDEDSPLNPQILQAAAMVNENKLQKSATAKLHYEFLKTNYPQTKEGLLAINKLSPPREDKPANKTPEVENQSTTSNATGKPDQPEKTEDEKWFLMDRRNK